MSLPSSFAEDRDLLLKAYTEEAKRIAKENRLHFQQGNAIDIRLFEWYQDTTKTAGCSITTVQTLEQPKEPTVRILYGRRHTHLDDPY